MDSRASFACCYSCTVHNTCIKEMKRQQLPPEEQYWFETHHKKDFFQNITNSAREGTNVMVLFIACDQLPYLFWGEVEYIDGSLVRGGRLIRAQQGFIEAHQRSLGLYKGHWGLSRGHWGSVGVIGAQQGLVQNAYTPVLKQRAWLNSKLCKS